MSIRLQHPRHREDELLPTGVFDVQAAAARAGQRVNAGAAVVLRRDHPGFDVASELQAMEGGVERTLAGVQPVAGDLADAVADAPAVIRPKRQDLENQQVERAL